VEKVIRSCCKQDSAQVSKPLTAEALSEFWRVPRRLFTTLRCTPCPAATDLAMRSLGRTPGYCNKPLQQFVEQAVRT
jgi:hypothetical protein